MVVSGLSCTDLPVMDLEILGGSSDPYVMFMTDPKDILWHDSDKKKNGYGHGWPKTKHLSKNLNPVWKDPLLLDMNGIACYDDLAGAIMYAVVFDYDRNSGDDIIGTVQINLQRLCSSISPAEADSRSKRRPSHKTDISAPIFRNGQVYGHFKCKIEAAWVNQSEFDDSVAFLWKTDRTKR